MYKELMILGFISFSIVIVQELACRAFLSPESSLPPLPRHKNRSRARSC